MIHLATEKKIASSTQNQALSALLFLYREILHKESTASFDTLSASKSTHLPTVFINEEAHSIIRLLQGEYQLIAKLQYDAGLRVSECLRMRVKDLDFNYRTVMVRDGKGVKERVMVLPESPIGPITEHLERVKLLHADNLAKSFNGVSIIVLSNGQEKEFVSWFVSCQSKSPGSTRLNRSGRTANAELWSQTLLCLNKIWLTEFVLSMTVFHLEHLAIPENVS